MLLHNLSQGLTVGFWLAGTNVQAVHSHMHLFQQHLRIPTQEIDPRLCNSNRKGSAVLLHKKSQALTVAIWFAGDYFPCSSCPHAFVTTTPQKPQVVQQETKRSAVLLHNLFQSRNVAILLAGSEFAYSSFTHAVVTATHQNPYTGNPSHFVQHDN